MFEALRKPLPWIAVLALALVSAMAWAIPAVGATGPSHTSNASSTVLLNRAYDIKLKDHPAFLRLLARLHQRESRLSPHQRWELHFLDAWQIAFAGNYAKANAILRRIIADSGDASVSARASALLIYTLNATHDYEASYHIAARLVSDLPHIKDPRTRKTVYTQVAQMLGLAGQVKLAVHYARQYGEELPEGASKCRPYMLEAGVQLDSSSFHSSSPVLKRAIESCTRAGVIVDADVMRLDKVTLLLREHRPRQALALLDSTADSITSSGYQRLKVFLEAARAEAYLQLGHAARARRHALKALSMPHAANFFDTAARANRVLYKVAKKSGHYAAALGYYEKYESLDRTSKNNAQARALAYQMVRQEVLARKLKVETLRKQNRILQLRQKLASKSNENNHLYFALLLLVLAFIAFWAYRTKKSQLRFRRMARHDDLTNAFSRQYFLDRAEAILARLEKGASQGCLLILDMDHFKQVNDRHGHIQGDLVLRHVAQTCHSELRDSDIFGRLGGEEFGIVMPGCAAAHGKEIGERIRMALCEHPLATDDGAWITVTTSIGLACTADCGYKLKILLTHADDALYEAKRNGRNRLIVSNGPVAMGVPA